MCHWFTHFVRESVQKVRIRKWRSGSVGKAKSRGFLLCSSSVCTLPQVSCQTANYCSGVPVDWQEPALNALAP